MLRVLFAACRRALRAAPHATEQREQAHRHLLNAHWPMRQVPH